MKRISIKLIVSIVIFLAANLWLISKGVMKGAATFFISVKVEEIVLFIVYSWQYLSITFLSHWKRKIINYCIGAFRNR